MFQNILQYREVRSQNAVARWLGGRSGNIVPKPMRTDVGWIYDRLCDRMWGWMHGRRHRVWSSSRVYLKFPEGDFG